VLADELARAGITIEGEVRRGVAPELSVNRRTLDTNTSRLAESVVITNKRSQNLYAEMILKSLGRQASGVGTFATGTDAVARWLERCVGIPRDVYHQVDGSGLSYENRFAPEVLARILAHMASTPEGAALDASLPVSGVDGTLHARFSDPELYARIHAKTGFLQGVSGLSGYLLTRGGATLPFSILVNAPDVTKVEMEVVEDAILRELVRQLP
jgi:D-alanyl-D-alanine carboxypeptidase/D-alanyl-D-alanine-endopeptidase (penicillin-binding protein 4)